VYIAISHELRRRRSYSLYSATGISCFTATLPLTVCVRVHFAMHAARALLPAFGRHSRRILTLNENQQHEQAAEDSIQNSRQIKSEHEDARSTIDIFSIAGIRGRVASFLQGDSGHTSAQNSLDLLTNSTSERERAAVALREVISTASSAGNAGRVVTVACAQRTADVFSRTGRSKQIGGSSTSHGLQLGIPTDQVDELASAYESQQARGS